jgi:hypothetical protein
VAALTWLEVEEEESIIAGQSWELGHDAAAELSQRAPEPKLASQSPPSLDPQFLPIIRISITTLVQSKDLLRLPQIQSGGALY